MKIAQPPDLRTELAPTQQDNGVLSATERKKLAAQFEALLVHELVKSMRSTVQPVDGNFGVSMSTDMMDQALSDAVSGRLGLGEHLMRQLDSSQQPSIHHPGTLPSRTTTEHTKTPAQTPLPAPLPSLDQITPIAARPAQALPVDGIVSSPYGHRVDPILGKAKEHHGIDIAAPQGQEIYAVRDGSVVFAGNKGGYGKTVEIKHNDGTISRYAHAHKIHVRVGDRVQAGECVADVGSTGRSSGTHLHFEIRKFGKSIDPLSYLKKAPDTP